MKWRTRTWLVVVLVLVLLAVWVLVPHPWEGPVLWSVSNDHGIHLGDLAGVGVAAGLIWLSGRASRRSSRAEP